MRGAAILRAYLARNREPIHREAVRCTSPSKVASPGKPGPGKPASGWIFFNAVRFSTRDV